MPSRRNSHCQADRCPAPLILARIHPEMGPATMPETGTALMKTATILARRFCVYQYVRYRITPGKKPDSTIPSRNRRA